MTAQEEKSPAAPGLLIPLALAAFAADVLIFYFTIEPLVAWSKTRYATPAWGILAQYGLRVLSAALFAGAMIHWRTLSRRDLGLGLRPFREDAGWTLRLIACLVIVSLLLIAIAVLVMRLLHFDSSHLQFETRSLGWTGYLLCSVVAAPLVEEFVYRSLLTPALRAGYGDRGAIAAGAALFYVLHLIYAQPWWRIHTLIAGAILTWAFLRRGRLWICVLLHAGGNLLVVLDDALLQIAPDILKGILGG